MGKSDVATFWKLVEDIGECMLVSEDGAFLRARPMVGRVDAEAGRIRFLTRADSAKTQEVEKDHQVCLCYVDPEDGNYVSVSGLARSVRDEALQKDLWTVMAQAWFEGGPDDPDVRVLEVQPVRAEYWRSDDNSVIALWEIGKALVTSSRPDLGENRKLVL